MTAAPEPAIESALNSIRGELMHALKWHGTAQQHAHFELMVSMLDELQDIRSFHHVQAHVVAMKLAAMCIRLMIDFPIKSDA